MAQVELAIGSRRYEVACKDGGEDRLRQVAALVDARAQDAQRAVGNASETRTLLLAALLLADELYGGRGGEEEQLPGLVGDGLRRLAERVERMAAALEPDAPRS